jgi:hypothetical protein
MDRAVTNNHENIVLTSYGPHSHRHLVLYNILDKELYIQLCFLFGVTASKDGVECRLGDYVPLMIPKKIILLDMNIWSVLAYAT